MSIIQGIAELLPVSSSAHVIVAEKLPKIDPTTPEATMLLVLLHTGTMLAVILYFAKSWRSVYFSSKGAAWRYTKLLAIATVLTGIVGYGLKIVIEKTFLRAYAKAEIEMIFGNLALISISLAAVGVLILYAGLRKNRNADEHEIGNGDATWIGIIQGLCLPFRGFSRSGATISVGLICGIPRMRAEELSFALAVILTPPVVAHELMRLLTARSASAEGIHLVPMLGPGLLGLLCSFLAGLLALRWLSRWLESGRWHWFGIYCLLAAAAVMALHFSIGH